MATLLQQQQATGPGEEIETITPLVGSIEQHVACSAWKLCRSGTCAVRGSGVRVGLLLRHIVLHIVVEVAGLFWFGVPLGTAIAAGAAGGRRLNLAVRATDRRQDAVCRARAAHVRAELGQRSAVQAVGLLCVLRDTSGLWSASERLTPAAATGLVAASACSTKSLDDCPSTTA